MSGQLRRHISIAVALAVLALSATIVAFPAYGWDDDYPFKGNPRICGSSYGCTNDGYGYYIRECTSFVAWRLRSRNGFTLPPKIGSAEEWGSWARSHGYSVNATPTVGSVAWLASGHVAWVEAVSGSNVTVEEYNFNYNHNYNERTVAARSFTDYIHFKDLGVRAPQKPSVAVSVPVPAPSSPPQPVSPSPINPLFANPAGALAAFAVGSSGDLETAWQSAAGSSWTSWVDLGGNNLTGTPYISPSATGALAAFVIDDEGDLKSSWEPEPGWNWVPWINLGGGNLVGSPVVYRNPEGTPAVFAIDRDGDLKTSWELPNAGTWAPWVNLGGGDLREGRH